MHRQNPKNFQKIIDSAKASIRAPKAVKKEYFPYGRACRGNDSNIIFLENSRNGYELFIIVSDTGTVKIIDFGSAVDLKNYSDVMAEPTYRKGFSPPEQYEKNKIPGTCSDLYALCATFYFCMTGLEPEDAQKRLKEEQFIGEKGMPEVIKKFCLFLQLLF